MGPITLFRRFALAEVVTWTLLIAGMILKYGFDLDWATRVPGGIHGFVFLCYVVIVVFLAVDQKWTPGHTIAGLVSAVIPFATIPFERWALKQNLVSAQWRLRSGGEAPKNPFEKVAAAVIARPGTAAGIALAVVAVIFVLLLFVGPPVG